MDTADERLYWIGALVLVASLPAIWASGHVSAVAAGSVRGIDLQATRLLVGAGAALFVGCSLKPASTLTRCVAVGVGIVCALGGLLALVSTEGMATIIPASLLPKTARRSVFGLASGPGLWLVMLAGLIVVLGSAGHTARFRPSLVDLRAVRIADPLSRAGQVAMALGCVLIGVGRNQEWLIGTWQGRTVTATGWSLPWIGPASLLAVFVIAVCALHGVWARPSAASVTALVAAAAAWIVAFGVGVIVVATDRLGQPAIRLAGERIGGANAAGFTPEVSLGAGLVTCLVGVALVVLATWARLITGAESEDAW